MCNPRSKQGSLLASFNIILQDCNPYWCKIKGCISNLDAMPNLIENSLVSSLFLIMPIPIRVMLNPTNRFTQLLLRINPIIPNCSNNRIYTTVPILRSNLVHLIMSSSNFPPIFPMHFLAMVYIKENSPTNRAQM